MKKIVKYSAIFALLGFGLGYIIGPSIYQLLLVCSTDPITGLRQDCMGDPFFWRIPVGIVGSIIGIIVGFIIGKINK